MQKHLFTFLRTEGLDVIMQLDNLDILNKYCKAVKSAEDALANPTIEGVHESLSAIKAVSDFIFDKSCDLGEFMTEMSHMRMSYGTTSVYENHPLEEALDEIVDNLEEVANALREADIVLADMGADDEE